MPDSGLGRGNLIDLALLQRCPGPVGSALVGTRRWSLLHRSGVHTKHAVSLGLKLHWLVEAEDIRFIEFPPSSLSQEAASATANSGYKSLLENGRKIHRSLI